jgi:hypothetical protein
MAFFIVIGVKASNPTKIVITRIVDRADMFVLRDDRIENVLQNWHLWRMPSSGM